MSKYFIKNFSSKVQLSEKTINKTALNGLSNLVKSLPFRDTLLISSQNIRWTSSELDTYTTAMAQHFIELGIQPSQKILIWTDISHTAESICSTIGAWKAGLSVVHSQDESIEEVKQLVSNSDVVIFSPFNSIDGKTRLELLSSSINSNKHFIQISHKSLPNTIKFKQAFNYGSGFNTNITLPVIEESSIAYKLPQKDITHMEIYNAIESYSSANSNKYENTINSVPCSFPSSMVLGFLTQITNQNYTIYPGSFSLKDIIKQIKMQKADRLICEEGLLDIELTETNYLEVGEKAKTVESLIVLGNSELTSKRNNFISKCFKNAKVEVYDIENFNKI